MLDDTKLTEAESLAIVFESLAKASHLNITKNITSVIGSQMGVESSLFGRLGWQSHKNNAFGIAKVS